MLNRFRIIFYFKEKLYHFVNTLVKYFLAGSRYWILFYQICTLRLIFNTTDIIIMFYVMCHWRLSCSCGQALCIDQGLL